MDKDTKLVLGVVIALLVLVFVFNSGLTGAWWFKISKLRLSRSTTPIVKPPSTNILPLVKLSMCYDSDGGKKYYTSGYCKSGNLNPVYDECENNILREAYCSINNTCLYEYVRCANGCANSGSCVYV